MNEHSTQLYSPTADASISVEVPTVRGTLEDATLPTPVRTDLDVFLPQIGKFRVVRLLGRGGQASAYEAFDPDLQRLVVLKVYDSARAVDEQEVVLREGQSLARVRSPYVAQCHGAERHGDVPYLIVEHVAGETLADRLRRERPTFDQALEWMSHLADGVAAIHACGLLHRDLKPSNILIDGDGRPRIIDFGLATTVGRLESQVISGTPAYMAPEVARGETQRIDVRADVFGLGAVFYELLAGRPPYVGKDPVETWEMAREGQVNPVGDVRPDTPASIAELCMRCLASEPERRLDSAAQLATGLARQLAARRLPATQGLSWTLRLGKFRIRLALGVSLAGLLLFAVALQLARQMTPTVRAVAFAPDSHMSYHHRHDNPSEGAIPASMAGKMSGAMSGTMSGASASVPMSANSLAEADDAKSQPDTPDHSSSPNYIRAIEPPSDAARKAGLALRSQSHAADKRLEELANAALPLRQETRQSEFGLELTVATGKQAADGVWHVRPDTRLQLNVTAMRDCQAALYLEHEDGSITQLVPNAAGDSGRLVRGQVTTWPGKNTPLSASRLPWDLTGHGTLHVFVHDPDRSPDIDWRDGSHVEFRSAERIERWRTQVLRDRSAEHRLIPVRVDLP